MPLLLPLAAFAFLVMGFRRLRVGWRASFLYASIPWSLFIAFITEALTPFRLVTRESIALSWLIFAIACFVWMWRSRRLPPGGENGPEKNSPLPWIDRAFLTAIALIAALTGVTAVASAPNTWDAMEYHLPRVVEWINNRGVQFFPTIDWSQLNQPPFAEYIMLHLDLLWGSDRLLGMVQWCAYLGCILGASLVAKELGWNRRSQIFAAVLSATVPSVVLAASSTKNDCVATYWIVVAVYLLLHWRHRQDWPHALAIGAALGLAVYTKGTSYVFLPCIVLACALTWNRMEARRLLVRLPAIAALGVLICLPLWVRNYRYTGSPMGFPYFYGVGAVNGRMFRTDRVTPPLVAANVIRNIALHEGVPDERANKFASQVSSRLIRSLGVDPNDPGQIVASQMGFTPKFGVRFNPRNEVLSEDPMHLFLFLLAGALFFAYRRRIGREIGWFGLGVVGAFVMYCALLRWSPWNARYQIPVFILGATFTAVVFVRILPRWAVNVISAGVLFIALALALVNETRPLLTRHGLSGSILTTPREQTYFFDSHREIADSWIAAARAARASGCGSIGLDANLLHFEYPMMAMLRSDNSSAPHTLCGRRKLIHPV